MEGYKLEDLIKSYSRKVFNLAYRLTGNRHDAEDVTQETFLQVYKGLEHFRGESDIYTWTYKIAVNNSLQVKRRLDRSYIDSLEQKIEQFKDDVPEDVKRWENDPEKMYLYDELLNTVKARLQRARTNLQSYFSSRCQWVEGKGGCSCEYRIGFALVFVPDILQRLRNYSYDNKIKQTVHSSLQKVRNIEEVYKSLPLEDYKTEMLTRYLTGA